MEKGSDDEAPTTAQRGEFKARLARAPLKEQETTPELGSQLNVILSQTAESKKPLVEALPDAFARGRGTAARPRGP